MYTTRYATIDEVPTICKYVYEGFKELGEKPNMSYIASSIARLINIMPVIVLTKGDDVVGCAPLRLCKKYHNGENYLTTVMYFVLKEHRSYANLSKITRAIRDEAKLHGLEYQDIFHGTSKDDARRSLIRRNGFKENGISFRSNHG